MNNQVISFKELAGQLSALDNEVKLQIIALLTERGALSITDISKELKLNFSTTHKYLEQLEKAKLLKSDTVLRNRLKRLFYVKDFDVQVSPKRLVQKKIEQHKPQKNIKVIDRSGRSLGFDIEEVVKKYIRLGVPMATINEATREIEEKAYDGITTLEIDEIFENFLKDKLSRLQTAASSIFQIKAHNRRYEDVLKLINPEVLRLHTQGYIFIQNLGDPKLLTFVHDIRGIAIHSTFGKAPKNLSELFDQTFSAIKIIKSISYPSQCIDSFNYFIAPLVEGLSKEEIKLTLKNFLIDINSLKINMYIGLESGLPEFLKFVPITYYYRPDRSKSSEEYSAHSVLAKYILEEVLKIKKDENLNYINPIIKIWNVTEDIDNLISHFDFPVHIANMCLLWQHENSSYSGFTRFDSEWSGWFRTIRSGEIQRITLNLPRVALESKTEKDFFLNLDELIKSIISAFGSMAELNRRIELNHRELIFMSVKREKWKYAPMEDWLYNIGIFGLNEALAFLRKKSISKDIEFARKVILFIKNSIKKYNGGVLRIDIYEQYNDIIIRRFEHLDSFQHLKTAKYSHGISEGEKIFPELQEFLKGGHVAAIPKKEFSGKEMIKRKIPYALVK